MDNIIPIPHRDLGPQPETPRRYKLVKTRDSWGNLFASGPITESTGDDAASLARQGMMLTRTGGRATYRVHDTETGEETYCEQWI